MEDAGEYMVIAMNEHGTFRFRITVVVSDKSLPKPRERKIIKTTTSKRTVTVVEETLVDGKVVERSVRNEVIEDKPGDVKEFEEASVHIKEVHEEIAADKVKVSQSSPKGDQLESTPKDSAAGEGTPPTFVEPPEPVYVDVGDDINLVCRIKGQLSSRM